MRASSTGSPACIVLQVARAAGSAANSQRKTVFELQAFCLGDGEDKLGGKRLLETVPRLRGPCQHDLSGRPHVHARRHLPLCKTGQEQGRLPAELPLLAHVRVGDADEARLQVEQRVGQAHDGADAAEVETEPVHGRHGDAARVKLVLHLLPAEAAGVHDLARVAREDHGARICRQSEEQRHLHVGEVLHLVADDQVLRELARGAVQHAQRRLREVELVPSP